uniref:Uncharacterized protein n=1 Tax=Plectus sambesii TaxID=2011161 RepID=A0A914XIN0_9BILA
MMCTRNQPTTATVRSERTTALKSGPFDALLSVENEMAEAYVRPIAYRRAELPACIMSCAMPAAAPIRQRRRLSPAPTKTSRPTDSVADRFDRKARNTARREWGTGRITVISSSSSSTMMHSSDVNTARCCSGGRHPARSTAARRPHNWIKQRSRLLCVGSPARPPPSRLAHLFT